MAVRSSVLSLEAITHEMRTPLTALKTQTQLLKRLQEDGKLSPEFIQLTIRRLDEDTERLITLCEQISQQCNHVMNVSYPKAG